MKKIKTAVVGTGYLGKFHAQKYASLEQSELVAVCDIDEKAAVTLARKLKCDAFTNYRDLVGKVDAVSIVAPTTLHHEIGLFFLSNNIHVLMEKPITNTLKEADELINLAKKNKLTLQVGHLERFNPVIRHIEPQVGDIRFIESVRLAPFNPRGTDVNVILDLMIHDIDLIQYLVKSPIIDIRANGASVISKTADITNARIEFENGCVANVTASRVSFKTERKMRIFQNELYMSLNLHDRSSDIYRRGEGNMLPGVPKVLHEGKKFKKSDAILDEIEDFLNAIATGVEPVVPGIAGKEALKAAIQITETLHESKQWNLDCQNA
jgi:predicted dehydrogenase